MSKAAKPSSAIRERINRVKKRVKKPLKKERIPVGLHLLRIILAVVVMISLFSGKKNLALFVFVITIAVGFLDYMKFQRMKAHSQMEAFLNSSADKLLVLLSSFALFVQGILPGWLLGVFAAKDIIFVISGIFVLRKNKHTVFKQTAISKITVFFQLLAIIAILYDKLDLVLLWVAVAFTGINIVFYFFKPEFHIRKKADKGPDFRFRKLLKLADFFTLANMIIGLLAITFAMLDNITLAAGLILLAVVFDVLDGKIARYTKSANEFGKQLDSLSDTVSFGVAPFVIGFSLTQTKIAILAFTVYLACGVLRLAKYNVMQEKGVYVGMPITIAGLIVAVLVLAGLSPLYLPYAFIILAMCMISPVEIKKKL